MPRPGPAPDLGESTQSLLVASAAAAAPAPATAVTTTAAAATLATAAAAAGAGRVLRLIDLQGATTHIDAIEILDGSGGIRLTHFDKTEAARTSGVPIDRKRHRLDRTVRRKQSAYLRIRRGKGKIPNVNFSHVSKNSKLTSEAVPEI